MAVNQVIYGGRTLVDLTGDTVTPSTLSEGVTAHDASGNVIIGEMTQPIKYIESLDESNLVNFRDLESGQYVIYGYFSPYADSDIAISADNSLISVINKTAGSHIICLDPLNAKIVFFEILVDETQEKGYSYTRTIVPVLDVYSLIDKVGTLENLNTEEKTNIVSAINEVNSLAGKVFNLSVTTGGSSSAYTATVPGVTSLTAGTSFIIIPHTASSIIAPTLNVNNLGAKSIRRRLTNSTTSTVAASSTNWLAANKPIRVMYDGSYWIADLDRPNANDIYGTVAVGNGGTGATTPESALSNLGGMPRKTGAVVIDSNTTLSTVHAEQIVPVVGSSNITVTIPSGTTIPVGTFITLTVLGTGTTTIATESSVTLNTKDAKKTIDGQYAAVTLYKYDDATWYAWGALA